MERVQREKLLLFTAEMLHGLREEGLHVGAGGREPLLRYSVGGADKATRVHDLILVHLRKHRQGNEAPHNGGAARRRAIARIIADRQRHHPSCPS
jgi:hypothetical protein